MTEGSGDPAAAVELLDMIDSALTVLEQAGSVAAELSDLTEPSSVAVYVERSARGILVMMLQ